jgi:hypothetical protein
MRTIVCPGVRAVTVTTPSGKPDPETTLGEASQMRGPGVEIAAAPPAAARSPTVAVRSRNLTLA